MKIIYKITFFIVFVINFFLIAFVSFGQDWNNYKVLRAVGEIPEDFTQKPSERYQEITQKDNDKAKDRLTRKAKEEFYLKSSYSLNDILLSGKILFGDPVTAYINKVADKILANQPDLRKQLRFYTVKSAAVNAFATNEGVICVNLGLMARVNNEAQLAYILCHEITHYLKKHSVEGYIFAKTVEKEKGVFKNTSDTEKRLANSNFSQENETEADLEGLKQFLTTSYDRQQPLLVFDLLKNADRPYEKLVFAPTALNTQNLVLPARFFEVDTVMVAQKDTSKKAIEELFSSHPNPMARKATIQQQLQNANNGQQLYLTSQEEFETARQLARFDLCDMFIIRGNYIDALYQTLLLKRQHPDSKYLDLCMAKSLYGIAKYQLYGQKIYYLLNYDEVDWEKQNWFFALEDLSEKELAILAASHLRTLQVKYPEDQYLKEALTDLSGDLVAIAKLPLSAEDKKKVAEEKKKAEEEKKKAEEQRKALEAKKKNTTKNNKGKSKDDNEDDDKETEQTAKKAYVRKLDTELITAFDSAWEQLSTDAAFIKMAEAGARAIAERRQVLAKSKIKTQAQAEKYYNSLAERKRKGYRLGLNKVILLNPLAMRVDETAKEGRQMDYLNGELIYDQMNKEIKTQAQNLGLEVRILDGQALRSVNQASILTQISVIKEWYGEEMRHIMPAINSRQDDIDAIVSQLGTSKVAFMGVISYKDRKKFRDILKIIPAGLFPPLLHQVFRPNNYTLAYTFVFDLKDTKILMEDYVAMRFLMSDAVLAQNIYFQLYQIKTRK